MARGDQRWLVIGQRIQQLASRQRVDEAAGDGVLVGGDVEERLVHEQRQAAALGPGGGVAHETKLIAGSGKVAAEQLRIDGDDAPARHIHAPDSPARNGAGSGRAARPRSPPSRACGGESWLSPRS